MFKGYARLELFVIVVITIILSYIVFIFLQPGKRFADARNSQRWDDVNHILVAIHEYIVNNEGYLPEGLTQGMKEIQLGSCISYGSKLCPNAPDLCLDLSSELAPYLPSIPQDPEAGDVYTTGYSVSVDSNSIITVKACLAENGEQLQVSR